MECVDTVSADLDAVRAVLAEDGLGLAGIGHDPWHAPRRFLHEPRYDAMETCLDRTGPAGRHMMCASASVQVCVDAGQGRSPARWGTPGAGGWRTSWARSWWPRSPDSPLLGRRPTGWRSTRQLTWMEIGAGRAGGPSLDGEPRAAWARHVLDSPVMCVRRDTGPWEVPEGLTFREWTRSGAPRPPTRADLDYHLTTLFAAGPAARPPGAADDRRAARRGRLAGAARGDGGAVRRPRGRRDRLPGRETAGRAGREPAPPRTTRCGWPRPGTGLADRELREAAGICFAAALEALPRLGATARVVDTVAAYRDRYIARGRCPADDLLDRLPELLDGPPAADPPRSGPARGTRAARGRKDIRTRPPPRPTSRPPSRDTEALRERALASLTTARARTTLLTSCVDEPDLTPSTSPLMSPLVWDLAHIGNQEELWLLRAVGGRGGDAAGDRQPLRRLRAPAGRSGPRCRCCRPPRPAGTRPRYADGRWTCWRRRTSTAPG